MANNPAKSDIYGGAQPRPGGALGRALARPFASQRLVSRFCKHVESRTGNFLSLLREAACLHGQRATDACSTHCLRRVCIQPVQLVQLAPVR